MEPWVLGAPLAEGDDAPLDGWTALWRWATEPVARPALTVVTVVDRHRDQVVAFVAAVAADLAQRAMPFELVIVDALTPGSRAADPGAAVAFEELDELNEFEDPDDLDGVHLPNCRVIRGDGTHAALLRGLASARGADVVVVPDDQREALRMLDDRFGSPGPAPMFPPIGRGTGHHRRIGRRRPDPAVVDSRHGPVLEVPDALDGDSGPVLLRAVHRAALAPGTVLAVDLSAVRSLDLGGMAALVAAAAHCDDRGAVLVVSELSVAAQAVLTLTGVVDELVVLPMELDRLVSEA